MAPFLGGLGTKALEANQMKLSHPVRLVLLALAVTLISASSNAQIFLSVHFGPPVLPVYVQPVCPAPNLIWMPGYWHYGPEGYYWVPGAWVPAPYSGALWTPGYWGWSGGLYVWHEGYWGPHVGYYGGVNYGFGYGGIGFAGGEWRGGVFAYNTAIIRVNDTVIHTTYIDRTIVERNTVANPNHVAYAGGPGGINHPPTAEERIAEHDQHVAPTKFQQQHIEAAKADKSSYAKNNGGHPAHLAAEKPLAEEKHTPPPGLKTESKPETKTPVKAETKPAPKAETKPAPKPETKPAPKPETKPATKPETKPAPKAATKPATAGKTKPEGHEK
jgi:hypothetical protein